MDWVTRRKIGLGDKEEDWIGPRREIGSGEEFSSRVKWRWGQVAAGLNVSGVKWQWGEMPVESSGSGVKSQSSQVAAAMSIYGLPPTIGGALAKGDLGLVGRAGALGFQICSGRCPVSLGYRAAPTTGSREINDINDYISIRIIDNGTGITDAKKAMTPYFTTKKSGTGLGLPIVTKIINEHSGYFSIKNRQEKNGIIITITLPKHV